jgi:hypothetical protein
MRTKITPPKLAAEWGVHPLKIHALIKAGQLVATNTAVNPTGRPRYLIDRDDIADFERRRKAVANG